MLSKEEVSKIARLARLEINEQEIEKMRKDLSGILGHFNSLRKVKGEKRATSISVVANGNRKTTREDLAKPQSQETSKKIIDSFPDKKGSHNKVKAIF